EGARHARKLAEAASDTDWRFEYSPESFTGTEPEFALEVCEAVMDVWEPTVDRPTIINLPSTVEMYTPNLYADAIEWFARNLRQRSLRVPPGVTGTIIGAKVFRL